MIRILIVDDHALIREGLRKVFRREDDIEVVAEAADAAQAVAQVRAHPVDVVVLDFNMPGRSGLDALPQIHACKPRLPVLILSMAPERDLALR
ncbi:MAG: response regulator transcription factor, partial [Rhodoferax sp.]|nr:response regulator transcription factor [Rhodoferax sp.]